MMPTIPMIYFYQNQRLDEMTREELIEAVKFLGTELVRSLEKQRTDADFILEMFRAKANER